MDLISKRFFKKVMFVQLKMRARDEILGKICLKVGFYL